MKGLIYSSMDKKAEAYKLARLALQSNITSHICWHVLSLLHRGDRNYHEALMCCRNALYHDSKNERVLRDLAQAQIHTRDYKGFFASRKKLLEIKSDNRVNWLGFALSAHLRGEHDFAISILSVFENATRQSKVMSSFETQHDLSELCLYKNYIIQETGNYEEALKDLLRIETTVRDKTEWKSMYASVNLKLGKFDDAKKAYLDLIDINPENREYHLGYQQSILKRVFSSQNDLTNDEKKTLLSEYDNLKSKYPRSFSVEQFPLLYWSEDDFETRFSSHVKPLFHKGVPSLFNGLKPLYNDPNKVKIIEKVVLNLYNNLKEHRKFDPNDEMEEIPSTLLWVLFYLSQHYNKLKNFELANKYINEAIEHTPTVIDLYLVQAKILRDQGKLLEAAEKAEYARTLDLADRHLNTISVKYWLRADQLEKAEENMRIFTLTDRSKFNNIYDMQVFWFEYECGLYYLRKGDIGMALKKFSTIEKHFEDIKEDQYSYHNYCIRMLTLRAYIRLLKFEDELFGQKYFVKAAQNMARIYIDLHHQPSEEEIIKKETEGMSESEKTKYMNKRKKERNARLELIANESKKKSWNGKYDLDPFGDKLKETKYPMKKATKYALLLSEYAPNDIETQKILFEVNMINNKILLALKALKKLEKINNQQQKDDLKIDISSLKESFKNKWKEVMDSKVETIRTFVENEIKAF